MISDEDTTIRLQGSRLLALPDEIQEKIYMLACPEWSLGVFNVRVEGPENPLRMEAWKPPTLDLMSTCRSVRRIVLAFHASSFTGALFVNEIPLGHDFGEWPFHGWYSKVRSLHCLSLKSQSPSIKRLPRYLPNLEHLEYMVIISASQIAPDGLMSVSAIKQIMKKECQHALLCVHTDENFERWPHTPLPILATLDIRLRIEYENKPRIHCEGYTLTWARDLPQINRRLIWYAHGRIEVRQLGYGHDEWNVFFALPKSMDMCRKLPELVRWMMHDPKLSRLRAGQPSFQRLINIHPLDGTSESR